MGYWQNMRSRWWSGFFKCRRFSQQALWPHHSFVWMFLSDIYAQLMDQFVVHVGERIIGEKSVMHQRLTKSNKRQVVVVKDFPRHLKENQAQRSIFIALKPMMKLKTALRHHFQTSCIFIPYQSTRLQKMTPKLS